MFNLNNITNINGYDTLSEQNQKLFISFLNNFIQVWGLEARATIEPLTVKFVKDSEGIYLRFDYKVYGKREWLHVTDENIWY